MHLIQPASELWCGASCASQAFLLQARQALQASCRFSSLGHAVCRALAPGTLVNEESPCALDLSLVRLAGGDVERACQRRQVRQQCVGVGLHDKNVHGL